MTSKLNNNKNEVEKMENIKTFSELDYRITTKEISDSISKLKNGKAAGLDGICAEMLKAGCSTLTPLLQKLFNMRFSSGNYPTQWTSAYISPVYKSGDSSQPENYRGIAINSCIGKVFNSVLNSRLDNFLETNNIIHNSQIGFCKKCRTSDHVFVLKTLIDKYINRKGGKLFACFIDLKKAFDTVIHEGIKYKLLKHNITGPFYNIIKNMYSKNSLCLRLNDQITPFFKSSIGVRQGDVLSPNIFKLFINDLPDMFVQCIDEVNVNNCRVDCLMYADDIVILSDTEKGLQKRLDILQAYCMKWCLNVNLNKTKVLVFNKTGKFIKCPIYFEGKVIESVNFYKYLGIKFVSSGKFSQAKDELYKKAVKASFKLHHCLSSCSPSISTSLHLYDHTIKPILFYGSEILGMFAPDSAACKKDNDYILEKVFSNDFVEKSHMKYMKYILGVNKKASNIAIMSELGRYPNYFSVLLSMLKYCHRLENLTDGFLYDAYICNQDLHSKHINTWFSSIEYLLKEIHIPNLNFKLGKLCSLALEKLCQSFEKYWNKYREEILKTQKGKLVTYFSLKQNFGREAYLQLNDFRCRQVISKVRISAHSLKIETDRYSRQHIERTLRFCTHCNDKVEDEQHFITECKLYVDLREKFYQNISLKFKNFATLTDKSKFIWLMTNENLELLKSLGLFIRNCFNIRKAT